MSLEKNGEIGKVGSYELEVNEKGVASASVKVELEGGVKASIGIEIDVVSVLEMLALKSDNKIDDSIVAMVKSALTR